MEINEAIQGHTLQRIRMFEVDLTGLNPPGPIYRFYSGTSQMRQPLVWQGNTYSPWACTLEGIEMSASGALPRPSFKLANAGGLITLLCRIYADMVGAPVRVKTTLGMYLDAVNFPSGNVNANPNAYFPDEIFFIERKVSSTRDVVEFELVCGLDLEGVKLPRRQVIANSCPWRYRGPDCGYVGTNYFDANDQPTDLAGDICSKRQAACKARFGSQAILPFGGFPGVRRI